MKRFGFGVFLLSALVACETGAPAEVEGTESDVSGTTATETPIDPAMLAQTCHQAQAEADCDAIQFDQTHSCGWVEVSVYAEAGECTREVEGKCLAYEFRPGPPSCLPSAGCENPREDPSLLIKPASRTLPDGTVEVIDGCYTVPIGEEIPFELCPGAPGGEGRELPCHCLCEPA